MGFPSSALEASLSSPLGTRPVTLGQDSATGGYDLADNTTHFRYSSYRPTDCPRTPTVDDHGRYRDSGPRRDHSPHRYHAPRLQSPYAPRHNFSTDPMPYHSAAPTYPIYTYSALRDLAIAPMPSSNDLDERWQNYRPRLSPSRTSFPSTSSPRLIILPPIEYPRIGHITEQHLLDKPLSPFASPYPPPSPPDSPGSPVLSLTPLTTRVPLFRGQPLPPGRDLYRDMSQAGRAR
jgi:hypothetical protein